MYIFVYIYTCIYTYINVYIYHLFLGHASIAEHVLNRGESLLEQVQVQLLELRPRQPLPVWVWGSIFTVCDFA